MSDDEDDDLFVIKRKVDNNNNNNNNKQNEQQQQQDNNNINTITDIVVTSSNINNTNNNNHKKKKRFNYKRFFRLNNTNSNSNNNNSSGSSNNNNNISSNGQPNLEDDDDEEIEVDDDYIMSPIDWIPDELLARIYGYLDPAHLGRAATVCSRFYKISYDASLWRDVLKQWELTSPQSLYNKNLKKHKRYRGDFDEDDGHGHHSSHHHSRRRKGGLEMEEGGGGGTVKNHPLRERTYYVERFKAEVKAHQSSELRHMEMARVTKYQQNIESSAKLMKYAFYAEPWYDILWLACIIFFSILLPLQCEGVIEWPWATIFTPLLPIVYLAVGAPITYEYFKYKNNYDYVDELGIIQERRVPSFVKLLFFEPLWDADHMDRLFFFTPILTIVTFLILIIVKLSDGALVSWGGVFVPLLILCVALFFFPFFYPHRINNTRCIFDQIFMIFINSLIFIFVILLYKKINNDLNVSWYYIFIPLFISDLALIFYPLVILMLKKIQRLDLFIPIYILEVREGDRDRVGGNFYLLITPSVTMLPTTHYSTPPSSSSSSSSFFQQQQDRSDYSTRTTPTTTTYGKIKPGSPSPRSSYYPNNIVVPPLSPSEVVLEEVIPDDIEVRDALFPPHQSESPSPFIDSPLTPIKPTVGSTKQTPRRWRLVPANCTCVVHDEHHQHQQQQVCQKCNSSVGGGPVSDQKPPISTPPLLRRSSSSSSHQQHSNGHSNGNNVIYSTPDGKHYRSPIPTGPTATFNVTPMSTMHRTTTTSSSTSSSRRGSSLDHSYISPTGKRTIVEYNVYPSGDYNREMQLLKTEVNILEDEFEHLKRSTNSNDRSRTINSIFNDESISREREEVQFKKTLVESEIKETQKELNDQVIQLKDLLRLVEGQKKVLESSVNEIHYACEQAQKDSRQLAHERQTLLHKIEEYGRELESRGVDTELFIELEQHVESINQTIDTKLEHLNFDIESKESSEQILTMEQAKRLMADQVTSQGKAFVLLEELTILYHKIQDLEDASQGRVDQAIEQAKEELYYEDKQKMESDIALLNTEIDTLVMEKDQKTQDLQLVRDELFQSKEECEALGNELRKLKDQEIVRNEQYKDKVLLTNKQLEDIRESLDTYEYNETFYKKEIDQLSRNQSTLQHQVQQFRSSETQLKNHIKDIETKHISQQEETKSEIQQLNDRIAQLLEENDDMKERLSKVHIVIQDSPRVPLSKETIEALTPSKQQRSSSFFYSHQPQQQQAPLSSQKLQPTSSIYQSTYKPPPLSSLSVDDLNGSTTLKNPIRQEFQDKRDSLLSTLKSQSLDKEIETNQEQEEQEEQPEIEEHEQEEEEINQKEQPDTEDYDQREEQIEEEEEEEEEEELQEEEIEHEEEIEEEEEIEQEIEEEEIVENNEGSSQQYSYRSYQTPLKDDKSFTGSSSSLSYSKYTTKEETMSPLFSANPFMTDEDHMDYVDENEKYVSRHWSSSSSTKEEEEEDSRMVNVLQDSDNLLEQFSMEDGKNYILEDPDKSSPRKTSPSKAWHPNNTIDKILLNHSPLKDEQQRRLYTVPTTVQKIDAKNGDYRVSNTKINLKLHSGELVVRVGGGYEKFVTFIQRHRNLRWFKDGREIDKKNYDQEIKNFEIQRKTKDIGNVTFIVKGCESQFGHHVSRCFVRTVVSTLQTMLTFGI
ncbi:hypothetical protein DFA_07427 [Cavenderia fasciculata]|uniref:F-box domain-containing protein n=1 Tax=Cavenderia fasciculata TaxID=261658 RepID=F4PWE0_CACFS|nr:uncharacterized protein DFA_07427 [Cavenderia fasciculata]EGG20304.1 hypothetical protein DFA_07427 [Cavenderia fasciculata]|eukprot:XP_004367287.1 hypothetical protein DFA_07427 [Cavenderia fasciculata]